MPYIKKIRKLTIQGFNTFSFCIIFLHLLHTREHEHNMSITGREANTISRTSSGRLSHLTAPFSCETHDNISCS